MNLNKASINNNKMLAFKKVLVTTFMISAALSLSLMHPDHDDHHDDHHEDHHDYSHGLGLKYDHHGYHGHHGHHGHYGHHGHHGHYNNPGYYGRYSYQHDNNHDEYLKELGIESNKKNNLNHSKHYALDNFYDTTVNHYYDPLFAYQHEEQERIHDHLHENSEKLGDIQNMLEKNNLYNQKQDLVMEKHTNLINSQIKLQKEDADRDVVQMDKLNKAVDQRKDIKKSVDDNKKLLGESKNNQNVMMKNQKDMDSKLVDINHKSMHILKGVKLNDSSLKILDSKADALNVDFKVHAVNLLNHKKDFKKHDEKQDAMIVNQAAHDERQTKMMGDVMTNQTKLNKIKDGQKVSQKMIKATNDNLKKHDENVATFAIEQLQFNDKVDAQMKKEDAQMKKENDHAADQKKFMKKQDKHIKMEALHMAESEDFMNHQMTRPRNINHLHHAGVNHPAFRRSHILKKHHHHGHNDHHGHHHRRHHKHKKPKRQVVIQLDNVKASPEFMVGASTVSYTHLTLPTNREV